MDKKEILKKLFEDWAGQQCVSFTQLPGSGSYREYFRLTSNNKKAIGVNNSDEKENIAFIEFTKHFTKKNLPVPQFYSEKLDNDIYLIEDLGGTTLFSYLTQLRQDNNFPKEIFDLYKKVLKVLPKFQINGGKDLDYSKCYPRAKFDRQSMMWDLSYFKYYFLKLAKISFDEQSLENDFHTFTDFLLQTDTDYFMYRDFQSRNVLLKEDKPYFVDYQGGRRGALQYDVASLLFDAKANIPRLVRSELLDYYIKELNDHIKIDEKEFKKYYYGYVLIRILQAMGAYGFRGFYEKKEQFLKSIPYAVNNLKWIINSVELPVELPAMWETLEQLVESKRLKKYGEVSYRLSLLTVSINSFSYKSGIPVDDTEHGGGFVFDCRAVHNPGRYEKYKDLTGKDKVVIEFFDKETEVDDFLNSVYQLVDQSVEKYLDRKYTNLMVNFGCTGGQHRSVYCAERLVEHLEEKYNIKITLKHLALEERNKDSEIQGN